MLPQDKLKDFFGEDTYKRIESVKYNSDKTKKQYGVSYDKLSKDFELSRVFIIDKNVIDRSQDDEIKGWHAEYKASSKLKGSFIMLEVNVSTDNRLIESDVLTLQHFFIRADRLLQNTEKKIVLVIHVRNSQNMNTFKRIEAYLHLQNLIRRDILILVHEDSGPFCRTLDTPTTYFRLLPLMRFVNEKGDGESPSEGFQYSRLLDPIGMIQSPDFDAFLNVCIGRDVTDKKSEEQWNKVFTQLFHDVYPSLEEIGWRTLHHFARSLAGTNDSRLKAQRKKSLLSEDIIPFLKDNLPQFNLIEFIIFSLFWGAFTESKELLLLDKDVSFNRVVANRIVSDATTYAQGIYELIENSCVHTARKVAYLSVRIHNVRTNDETLAAREGSIRRDQIEKRYEGFIENTKVKLDKDARLYLELHVLDDAQNPDNPDRTGISSAYRKNHLKEHQDITLKEMFSEDNDETQKTQTEQDAKMMIMHYGIPLCNRLIRINKGVFFVRSPKGDGTERYTSISSKKKEVVINNTRIEYSPSGCYCCPKQESSFTLYQILIPLSSQKPLHRSQAKSLEFSQIFTTKELTEKKAYESTQPIIVTQGTNPADSSPFSPCAWTGDTLQIFSEGIASFNDKCTAVLQVANELEGKLFSLQENGHRFSICQIDCSGALTLLSLEILCKAIFYNIAKKRIIDDGNQQSKDRILMSVYFENQNHLADFIRFFSVFYISKASKSSFENVHIALCGKNSPANIPEVKCYLSGEQFNSVYESAEIFMYHNYESAIEQYYLLDSLHLLAKGMQEPERPPCFFPFDLYLTRIPFQAKASSDNEDCWFLKRMSWLLNQSFTGQDIGCRIEDIHVRLGSKMHMHGFYYGELLFHNISIIQRFAYLIVRDLEISTANFFSDGLEKVVILGYESYSALMTESIAALIESAFKHVECYVLTLRMLDDGSSQILPHNKFRSLEHAQKRAVFEPSSTLRQLFILPVGTTLSTLYKMRTQMKRYLEHKDICNHFGSGAWDTNELQFYSLIQVGNSGDQALTRKYWTQVNGTKRLRLEPEGFGAKDQKIEATYLLYCKTVWHLPEDCEEDQAAEQLLSYVQKSSVLLNTTHVLEQSPGRGFLELISLTNKDVKQSLDECLQNNDERLEHLRGCIRYGHIGVNGRHYMYYFDLGRFMQNANRSDVFRDWCKKQRKSICQLDRYNVIVSPLNVEASPFLKVVCEEIFGHSVQLMNIDILETTVEETRTRFSYIREAIKSVLRCSADSHVDIYFVDHSIVTGETVNRARELIRALLPNDGAERIHLFKGVFTLLNQSNLSTIRNILPDGALYAFAHLNIPNYNMIDGRCPACDLRDKYKNLMNASSTTRFVNNYKRLRKKHALRSLEDYDQWQQGRLFTSPRVFLKLRQWLYCSGLDSEETISAYNNEDVKAVARAVHEIAKAYKAEKIRARADASNATEKSDLNGCRAELYQLSLDQCLNHFSIRQTDAHLRKSFERVWSEYVMADTAYLRVMSAHSAFMEYEKLRAQANENDITLFAEDWIQFVLRQLQAGPVRMMDSAPFDSPQLNANRKIEGLISNLKVLARPMLSKYFDIARAVFTVYNSLAKLIFNHEKGPVHAEDLLKSVDFEHASPLLRYQLGITVLYQLSSMQGRYLLGNENLKQCYEQYCNWCDETPSGNITELFYMGLPDRKTVLFAFENCLKWSSLSTNEEYKCFRLRDQYSIWQQEE